MEDVAFGKAIVVERAVQEFLVALRLDDRADFAGIRALAQEDADPLTPSDLDPDYADLDQAWRAA